MVLNDEAHHIHDPKMAWFKSILDIHKEQAYLVPKKSVFNRIIGDSPLELEFAGFLENCPDFASYVKNYLAVQFKLDYVNAKGEISNYFPDFIVKQLGGKLFVVETKGLEDLDVPLKMDRLKQWCADVNVAQNNVHYDFVFVDQDGFKRYKPISFSELLNNFTKYKS